MSSWTASPTSSPVSPDRGALTVAPSARALATLYGGLLSGEIVGREALDRYTEVWSEGDDEVLLGRTRFGLGYMLPNEMRPFAPSPRAFGHSGSGGALGFADPDAEIAFGYTPNRLIFSPSGPDPRWTLIVGALYGCL
ncbi:beta-lactamase family protein [Planotetraspora sp. A-T 1434]|nr:serine hydrolase domain-containing protein [Planotetraspora sp. A-T 1434]MCT9931212.1 beta-lactamase family protein [Planotetraspora sp. A-T 1434]